MFADLKVEGLAWALFLCAVCLEACIWLLFLPVDVSVNLNTIAEGNPGLILRIRIASWGRSQQCWGGKCCCVRAASLCPTGGLKKSQTSDVNPQEHAANRSVTLARASCETIVHVAPFQSTLLNGERSSTKNKLHSELLMLVFACVKVELFCSFWRWLN